MIQKNWLKLSSSSITLRLKSKVCKRQSRLQKTISGRVAELGEIVDFPPILGTKKSFVLRVHQVYMVHLEIFAPFKTTR